MHPMYSFTSSFEINIVQKTNGFQFRFILHDGLKEYLNEPTSTILPYDTWHHLVITYDQLKKFEILVNGCEWDGTMDVSNNAQWAPETVEVILGCQAKCPRAVYDDLRIWNAKKNSYLLWHLYSEYLG